MKLYCIRTKGNEDNCFQDVVCKYDCCQFVEMVKMLKEANREFTTWEERR